MARQIVRAEEYAIKVCEALGVDHTRVRRVVIDAKAGEALQIYVQFFGSSEILDIDLPFTPENPVEIVKVNG